MHKKKFKVAVVGDLAVGKTNLIKTYTEGGSAFTKDYNMTQVAEASSKVIAFEKEKVDVQLILVQISGQPIYQSVAIGMLKNIDFIIAVYDCTNSNTFLSAFEWYGKAKKANENKSLKGCLVASKSEHKSAKEVQESQAKQKAQKLGLEWFEVSSALNTDVEKPFEYLSRLGLSR